MANTYTNLLYHIIFSTKNRLPLICESFQPDLYQYIGGTIRGERGILIEIGGMPDHIHLLAKFKTNIAISDMLRIIKANSSKWINEHWDNEQRFAWQDGYGAFTVSESQLPHVVQYIRSQKSHHQKKTFQHEYLEFLKQHNVDYDERYLWI